jgi:hypothetical protein
MFFIKLNDQLNYLFKLSYFSFKIYIFKKLIAFKDILIFIHASIEIFSYTINFILKVFSLFIKFI